MQVRVGIILSIVIPRRANIESQLRYSAAYFVDIGTVFLSMYYFYYFLCIRL